MSKLVRNGREEGEGGSRLILGEIYFERRVETLFNFARKFEKFSAYVEGVFFFILNMTKYLAMKIFLKYPGGEILTKNC